MMDKRVQFATNLESTREKVKMQDHSHSGVCSASSGWYSTKELKTFRKEISASLDAEVVRKGQPDVRNRPKVDEVCMRGLELYSSNVRRDLQRHYSKSILKAQRRIKARRKRKQIDEEDESRLLQRIAEKYSQYARERAVQMAARDEVDSREAYAGSAMAESNQTKKSCRQQNTDTSSIVQAPEMYRVRL